MFLHLPRTQDYGFRSSTLPHAGEQTWSNMENQPKANSVISRHQNCTLSTFIRHYSYKGYLPEVKQHVVDMTVNGIGIRDTDRVLGISPMTVIEE